MENLQNPGLSVPGIRIGCDFPRLQRVAASSLTSDLLLFRICFRAALPCLPFRSFVVSARNDFPSSAPGGS